MYTNNIHYAPPQVGKKSNDLIKNITASLTVLFSRITANTAVYINKERVEARAWEVLRRLLRGEPLPDNDPDAGTFKMYFDTCLHPFWEAGALIDEVKSAVRDVPGFPFSKTVTMPTKPTPEPKPGVEAPTVDTFPHPFHLSVAYGKHQDIYNKVYPDYVLIDNMAKLLEVAKHDHCAALMRDNKRGGGSFLGADCLVFDVDNTHTDDPAQWITPEDIKKALPYFNIYSVPSRNNMKPKNGKTPRPKHHYFIPLNRIENESKYTTIIKNIINDVNNKFGHEVFDIACKDSTRPWFGNGGNN